MRRFPAGNSRKHVAGGACTELVERADPGVPAEAVAKVGAGLSAAGCNAGIVF
jgi:hypothetical protein